MCVCVFVHGCTWFTGACRVLSHTGHRSISGVVPQKLATLFFEAGSFTVDWGLLFRIAWLVSKRQGSSCLCWDCKYTGAGNQTP